MIGLTDTDRYSIIIIYDGYIQIINNDNRCGC